MNTLPALFEERMRKLLPEESEAFFAALQTEPPVSIRLNPGKPVPISRLFPDEQIGLPVSWCESAYYLKSRPVFTLDPCLHSGTYYVQEASSMFLYHIFGQILPAHPVRVLDLCAAPGGKSTLIASRLSSGSLLVANEVIRSRAGILKENMIKWGTSHVVVTNNDPADFHHLKGAFDIIVVDAPCSGEGMFRKDPGAIQEWNESNLQLCSERQQRILADIWPCLKPGGFLVYSTCTYNPGENEAILERLIRKYGARSIEIAPLFPGIVPGNSTAHCYHFYPHRIPGEGFFTGVVQKNEGEEFRAGKVRKNTKHGAAGGGGGGGGGGGEPPGMADDVEGCRINPAVREFGRHRSDLLQESRFPRVVGVEQGDQVARRLGDGAVACRADPGVRLRDELHERRCDGTHGAGTPVRRSVVHDDDLRGLQSLCEHRV